MGSAAVTKNPPRNKSGEKTEAIRRARKLARKKMQREGLLPLKPRVIPGAPGRGGHARALSFPKIISGRIDDAVRPRLEWRQ